MSDDGAALPPRRFLKFVGSVSVVDQPAPLACEACGAPSCPSRSVYQRANLDDGSQAWLCAACWTHNPGRDIDARVFLNREAGQPVPHGKAKCLLCDRWFKHEHVFVALLTHEPTGHIVHAAVCRRCSKTGEGRALVNVWPDAGEVEDCERELAELLARLPAP
jgi:hypothetical protein